MRLFIAIVVVSIFLNGCESSRYIPEHGNIPCIGVLDEEDPRFRYKPSVRNLIIGLVFLELIIPPVLIVANEIACPVSVK